MTSPDIIQFADPPGRVLRNAAAAPRRLERSSGEVRISFRADGASNRLDEFFQSGSARVRLPRVAAGLPPEAVLLNTAGGLTGGDRMKYRVELRAGARAVVTTQAAERIYRRSEDTVEIDTELFVGEGAALDWLPQETILFDRSALRRRLVAQIAPSATLLAMEAIVLGRAAMGETADDVSAIDSWRIRRGDRLIFADGLRLIGNAGHILSTGATGGGAAALATLVLVAPDAEARLDAARAALDDAAVDAGASAWHGMLVARLLAPGAQALRTALVRVLVALRDKRMPRVWQC